MNVEKFSKSVRRELTRNPKKTATLGLMCLVALYFWAPLLLRWLPGDDSNQRSTAQEATQTPSYALLPTATAPSGSAPAEATAPATFPNSAWRQLVQWMEREQYMQPAQADQTLRDPFSRASASAASLAGSQGPVASADVLAQLRPEDMNLALGSTIVGPQQRLAMINGRAYREGATVRVGSDRADDDDAQGRVDETGVEFVVAEIHPRHVVLERLGHQYSLRLKQPAADGDLQVVRREQ